MKILLANPPWRKGSFFGVRAGTRWPFMTKLPRGNKIPDYVPFPFFLAYTAALLKNNGFDIFLVDAIAKGIDDIEYINIVKNYFPDLLIQETSTPSIQEDISIAKKVYDNGYCKQIAFSGPHVSIYPKEFLKQNPDIAYLLTGEYEFTALELAQKLKKDKDLRKIKGLVFREGNEIIENPQRELIDDLDLLPFPERDMLPMQNYRDSFCNMPQPTAQIWASRGCPFGCIFCLWPEVIYKSRKYRTRNPVKVAEEMKMIEDKYHPGSIFFDDDTFNIGKERLLKLTSEIKKRKIKTQWAAMARPDTSDEETIAALKEAGMKAIKYGIESADPEILSNSGKALKLEKASQIIADTKKLGIKTHLTFTIGLPGETEQTVMKTLEFALKMDPDSAQFSICTPFPGTKYFQTSIDKGYLNFKSFSDFDGAGSAVISTESLSGQDLEVLLERMQKTWRIHKMIRSIFTLDFSAFKRLIQNPKTILMKLFSKC
jgi:anaerobic magnesium-protoporphyrin IX monomethyl ester cyclase